MAVLLAAVSLAALFLRIPADRISRRELYVGGGATAFLLGAIGVGAWIPTDRPLPSFLISDGAVAAGAAWALLLVLAVWLAPGRAVAGLYRRYAWMMPRTRGELVASWAVSLAAGVGEEMAYRGFLLGYSCALAGPAAAVALSSLLFGAAHGYQGRFGMVFGVAAGVVLALAFLPSGSLLLPIWMHATWNVAAFTLGYRLRPVLQSEPPAL